MDTQLTTISYQDQRIEAVRLEGRILVRVCHIWQTLGVPERTAWRILSRDADLFVEGIDTDFIDEMTKGGKQKMRVLTLSGLRILAMRANTPQARDFQRFLAGMIRGEIRPPRQASLPLSAAPLGTEARRIAEFLLPMAEDSLSVKNALECLLSGAASLPPDPVLEALVEDMETVRAAQSQAAKARLHWQRRVQLAGYSPEVVERAARRAA